MKRLVFAAMLLTSLLTLTTVADFIQCNPNCTGTPNADLVNGTEANNEMNGEAGNDVMFGDDGMDRMFGGEGDDVMFGGNGRDVMFGGPGNDTIIPGPCGSITGDLPDAQGDEGDDGFIVLAGETVGCQFIQGGPGHDELFLIGFGPYVAEYPYGQPEPIAIESVLVIQDPVGGGYVFVLVETGLNNLERINGLPSPNVTVLDDTEFFAFSDENCPQVFN